MPAGIVNRKRKKAGFPPNKSASIYITGQNATHAEITKIFRVFPDGFGSSTLYPKWSVRIFFAASHQLG